MKIKIDDIKYFIRPEGQVSGREGILSFLFVMLIVCIPTAIFGLYFNITSVIRLPIIDLLILWESK